jgi:hypothetical protein
MYPKTYYSEHKIEPQNATCFVLMPFASGFREIYDGVERGRYIQFEDFPWTLKLEKISENRAYFSVIPK